MLGGYVVEELDVEHHVAQPVRDVADDIITRCREHMARIEELIARSRALRGNQ